jgi:DNA-binding SARP family transcriptional activator/tetratricopeptide (TPR) repeat protein
MGKNVAFRILGPLEVSIGGSPIEIAGRRQRLVLGVLLLAAGRPVSVDRLIELAWFDEEPPPSARNGLQVSLSRLRAAIGGTAEIITTGDAYRLEVDPLLVDVHRFRTMVVDSRLMTDDAAAAMLCRADALWRGPVLLDTIDDNLRDRICGGLEEERRTAVEERIDRELALGKHQRLISELVDLSRAHPTRERLIGQLMLALYREGRTQESLDAFRQARHALADQLGLDPSPTLRDLEFAILQHDPKLQPAGTAKGPTDNRIVPAQLPMTIRGFTGRDAELQRLDALLDGAAADPDAVPIAVISGMAGVGKTSLALTWAHRIATAYPDGQLYFDLRGHSVDAQLTPIAALGNALRALGFPREQIPDSVDEASAFFRSVLSDRRLMIVLDNARSAAQIRPLLPGGSGCLVIITSRYRLDELQIHDGAQGINLDVLAPAEAEALITDLIGIEHDAASPGIVADIARLCAYLPLALRIAVARLWEHPDRGITWYRDELLNDDRLTALALHGDDEIAVRAAFDLSYRLIPAPIQRLFRLLGLIPGTDFGVESVAALAGMSLADAKHGLSQLTSAHLIRRPTHDRYDFHDLIRDYAHKLAAVEPEREHAYQRLYGWYAAGVEAATTRLYANHLRLPAHDDQTTRPDIVPDLDDAQHATDWLDQEYTNLGAAIGEGVRNGQAYTAVYLADGLRKYLEARASLRDWLVIAAAAVAAANHTGDLRAQASAHFNIASAYGTRNDYARSIDSLKTAQALFVRSGWELGAAYAAMNIGVVYGITGKLAAAYDSFLRIVDASERLNAPGLRIMANTNIGYFLVHSGQPAQAIDWLNEALGMARVQANVPASADILDSIGTALHQLHQLDEARENLIASLAGNRQLGRPAGVAYALAHLSAVAQDQGYLDEANDIVNQALVLAETCGSARIEAEVLNSAAALKLVAGDADLAEGYAQRAYDLARHVGARRPEIGALLNLAKIHRALGNVEAANDFGRNAFDLAENGGYAGLALDATAAID